AVRKASKRWITACEKPATPVSTTVHDRDALRARAKALTVDQLNEFKALNLDPNDLAGIATALDRIENPSTTVEMAARIRAADPPKPAQAAPPAKPDEGDTISDDD